jgi:hypothetical protein
MYDSFGRSNYLTKLPAPSEAASPMEIDGKASKFAHSQSETATIA